MKILLLIISVFLPVAAQAISIPDSLQNKSFDELHQQARYWFNNQQNDKGLLYFEAYKNKAAVEQNQERLVNGYRSMAIWQENLDKGLVYADSAIHIALQTNKNEYIGNAYYTKGVVSYSANDWINALENYFNADLYISKTNDEYLKHKIKFSIGSAKYILGDFEEALAIKEKCAIYFSSVDDNNHNNGYLNSLHSIGLYYNRLGNYSKASEINKIGKQQANKMQIHTLANHFIHSEGINKYFLQDHHKSIELLKSVLSAFLKKNDYPKLSLAYFFLGKNYIELDNTPQAITYFKKVDSLFGQTGYLRDDMSSTYTYLIEHAQANQDLAAELYYTNRLLDADQFVNNQYKDVVVKLHKDYDVKKLQESKIRIEKLLGRKNANITGLSFLLLASFIGLFIMSLRYIYYKKEFRKAYREFIVLQESNQTKVVAKETQIKSAPRESKISQKVLQRIAKGLEQFEKNKGFAKENMNLTTLAKSIKTNKSYMSEAIHLLKQTDFNTYIDELRINYLLKLIRIKTYREYKIEALAKEIGFSSAKGFNSFFKRQTKMSFSRFLKKYEQDLEQKTKARYAAGVLESA